VWAATSGCDVRRWFTAVDDHDHQGGGMAADVGDGEGGGRGAALQNPIRQRFQAELAASAEEEEAAGGSQAGRASGVSFPAGRGLHSSTFRLNLSRFRH